MKYLKKFNENKTDNVENIRNDIGDIFIDLCQDLDLHITVHKRELDSKNIFYRVDLFSESRFEYSQISEEVERLKDYMAMNDFYCLDFSSYFGPGGEKKPKIQLELNRQFNRFGDGRWTEKAFFFQISFKSLSMNESQNSGSGNTSFDFLKKQNNERYFELVNILQTEVFDDYSIFGKRGESFASDDDNDWPKHKFWAFRLKNARSTDEDFSEFGELKPGDEIDSVTIYNIQEGEKDEIFDLLLEIRGRVRGYLNKEMIIFQESVVGEFDVVTDIVIKLEDSPRVHLPDSEQVKKWTQIINNTYKVKESEILGKKVKYILIDSDDKPIYLTPGAPGFNKGRVVDILSRDLMEFEFGELKGEAIDISESSLRKALKDWIDTLK